MSWDAKFDDPDLLPGGKEALALRDAGEYFAKLLKKEAAHERWQAATEALLMAVEKRGPVMHARIGMLKALQKEMPPPRVRAKISSGDEAAGEGSVVLVN